MSTRQVATVVCSAGYVRYSGSLVKRPILLCSTVRAWLHLRLNLILYLDQLLVKFDDCPMFGGSSFFQESIASSHTLLQLVMAGLTVEGFVNHLTNPQLR